MPIIYLTGLSGVGKTSALNHLQKLGYKTVDTDYGGYIKETPTDAGIERVLDEEKLELLITNSQQAPLFISGCYDNQGKFYKDFDVVVLLTANLDVMLERIDQRVSSNYGKSPEERAEVLENYQNVLPLLEKSSDVIIDTTHQDSEQVCKQLIALL